MKRLLTLLSFVVTLGLAVNSQAVPVLQVGAPGGVGEGIYADYLSSLTDPTENDTAITSGSTLYVGGVYGNKTDLLGSAYDNDHDWSDFSLPAQLDTYGALLLAAVPEGNLTSALSSLKVNGSLAIYGFAAGISAIFPNNHDPLKDAIADFLFFDIGDFANNTGAVPDFDDETGAANGEVKTLTLTGIGSLEWIHFDVMALETIVEDGKKETTIATTIENNPGSHDVTWKPVSVPEPSILILLGTGLLGLSTFKLRNRRK